MYVQVGNAIAFQYQTRITGIASKLDMAIPVMDDAQPLILDTFECKRLQKHHNNGICEGNHI